MGIKRLDLWLRILEKNHIGSETGSGSGPETNFTVGSGYGSERNYSGSTTQHTAEEKNRPIGTNMIS
jgi:hypothetical protein